jgi:hypothetical protein
MKKYILFLLIPIFLGGCEKNYNNVVDSQISYQIESVSSFDNYVYSASDSLITISLKVNSSADIKDIYFDIYSSDNNKLNDSPVELYDNGVISNGDTTAGDNKYSARFPMSRSYPVGLYTIKYFITDINNNTKQAAIKSFEYDNNQNDLPPQISDLAAPDTVKVADPKSIIFMSVSASDPNGSTDIKEVYFISYRPDGSTSNEKNQMYDDGDDLHGDLKAGDGIYSILIQVTPQNTKGIYKFNFRATDRSNKLSNIISHNIVIQ